MFVQMENSCFNALQENVDEWLDNIGLSKYKDNFKKVHICSKNDMEILKTFGRSEIKEELDIHKDGEFVKTKKNTF